MVSFLDGFGSSAKQAVGEVWDVAESAGDLTEDALRGTGGLIDTGLRSGGQALIVDPAETITGGTTTLIEGTVDATRDLTGGVGEGSQILLGGVGRGLEGTGQGLGSGLERTGAGVEGLGTFGGFGLTVLAVAAIALFIFLEAS